MKFEKIENLRLALPRHATRDASISILSTVLQYVLIFLFVVGIGKLPKVVRIEKNLPVRFEKELAKDFLFCQTSIFSHNALFENSNTIYQGFLSMK